MNDPSTRAVIGVLVFIVAYAVSVQLRRLRRSWKENQERLRNADSNFMGPLRFQRPLKRISVPIGWGVVLASVGLLRMMNEDRDSVVGLMLFVAAGCAWFWAMLAVLLPYLQVDDGSVIVRRAIVGAVEQVRVWELEGLDELQEGKLYSLARKNGGGIEIDLDQVRQEDRATALRVLERIVQSQKEDSQKHRR